jgi:hypothetical protein
VADVGDLEGGQLKSFFGKNLFTFLSFKSLSKK